MQVPVRICQVTRCCDVKTLCLGFLKALGFGFEPDNPLGRPVPTPEKGEPLLGVGCFLRGTLNQTKGKRVQLGYQVHIFEGLGFKGLGFWGVGFRG